MMRIARAGSIAAPSLAIALVVASVGVRPAAGASLCAVENTAAVTNNPVAATTCTPPLRICAALTGGTLPASLLHAAVS